MNKLAIIGASGHGKVAAEIAEKLGWIQIDFYDEKSHEIKTINKWEVIGDEQLLNNNLSTYDGVFVAIGNNEIRSEKLLEYIVKKVNLVNLIAPSAVISQTVKLGVGVLISEGACVNIDTVIGDGVIINTNANVDHDCQINSYAHVCPGVNIAGNVSVGKETMIGIGSNIIQGVSIGSNVIIGAGSVLISDIPKNVTVVGQPAKIIK